MVDRPSLDRLRVITAAAPDDDDDAATNGDDEFGWQPDEDDRIVLPAQQRFFENVVLPLLPTRKRQHGSERGVTEGEWKLNDGLIHRPPEPGLDGRSVTVESMCLVPVLVWCDLRPIFDSLWLTFAVLRYRKCCAGRQRRCSGALQRRTTSRVRPRARVADGITKPCTKDGRLDGTCTRSVGTKMRAAGYTTARRARNHSVRI